MPIAPVPRQRGRPIREVGGAAVLLLRYPPANDRPKRVNHKMTAEVKVRKQESKMQELLGMNIKRAMSIMPLTDDNLLPLSNRTSKNI